MFYGTVERPVKGIREGGWRAARPCSYVGPGQLAALPCNCWLTVWTAETSEQRQMVVPLTSLSGRDSAHGLIEFKCWDSKPACCLHALRGRSRGRRVFSHGYLFLPFSHCSPRSPSPSCCPSYGLCALYLFILISTLSALSTLILSYHFVLLLIIVRVV